MIYRGPNFLAVYDSAPEKERQLADRMGGGEEGGRGAESYDGEKVWSSINHSILSAPHTLKHCSLTLDWLKGTHSPDQTGQKAWSSINHSILPGDEGVC
jgi:hypothetical protein